MIRAIRAQVMLGIVLFTASAHAQAIPVRSVALLATTDSGMLGSIASVRSLPYGRVLINDQARRRLLMLDSTLARLDVVADTAPGAPNRYGPQLAGLFAYLGDSSVFVDREAQALVVVDPAGRFHRTMAPPNVTDLGFLTSSLYGIPGTDPQGRLVYRTIRRAAPRAALSGAQSDREVTYGPDSAPILRVNLETRAIDTAAMMKIPTLKYVTIAVPGTNNSSGGVAFNPLPTSDEWTLLPDGTIAIVRGQDYHVDWILADGSTKSSPKIPFGWRRISREEKVAILDSVKKVRAAQDAKNPAPLSGSRPGLPPMPRVPFTTVEPDELPDFYPPVRQGQVKADPAGNVWILPSTSALSDNGLVYDVVNRSGVLAERVKLPKGYSLVGFGGGGIVYIGAAVGGVGAGVKLARARVAR